MSKKTTIAPTLPDPTIPTDQAQSSPLHGRGAGGEVKAVPAKGSKRQAAKEFLRSSYDFRFNEIKGKPEYRAANSNHRWHEMNDYKLNSLADELDAIGYQVSTASIKEILGSDFSPMVNPVKDYFAKMPAYTTTIDYIKQLADTVETGDPQFYTLFKKWIVSTVACATTDDKINETCLVLASDVQGQGKTTWLNKLTPPALTAYRYSGNVDLESKDTYIKLAENFIINIDDQIHQLNKRDENSLKNFITAPYVKCRRPYAKFEEEYPRIASCVASLNDIEFLADTTGSRRFIPFHPIAIDKYHTVDIDSVYCQALYLYKVGFQYWFDDAEVAELNKRNKQFNIVSSEEQMVLEYLELPPAPGKFETNMQPALLLNYLQNKCSSNIRLSQKKLGQALKKHGYQKTEKQGTLVYSFIKKDDVVPVYS